MRKCNLFNVNLSALSYIYIYKTNVQNGLIAVENMLYCANDLLIHQLKANANIMALRSAKFVISLNRGIVIVFEEARNSFQYFPRRRLTGYYKVSTL